jgi:hypothetical protein
MMITPCQYWRVYLLALLSCVLVLQPLYARTVADCSKAESFIEEYYEDLENNDVKAAGNKWTKSKVRNKRFAKNVRNMHWASVKKTELDRCTRSRATVFINVTVKSYRRSAEEWEGQIYLKSIRGGWKISSMDLGRVD